MRTTDLTLFEADADEARAVIAAAEDRLEERLGWHCTMTVCNGLTEAEIGELFRLQRDAFGGMAEVFDRAGLDAVLADEESLFVLLWRGDHLVGASFGYWEWPEEITVKGTDFFLDTGMVEGAYRGKGIGEVVLTALVLLVRLLDCHRVGVAAWKGNKERLVPFYRRLGFVELADAKSENVLMWADLEGDNVGRWRSMLGLDG